MSREWPALASWTRTRCVLSMAKAKKKLLTKSEISSLGDSLLDVDLEDLSRSVIETLGQSPQTSMKQYPSRSTFVEKIQSAEMQEKLEHVLLGLCQLYKAYLVKYKAKKKIDKYAAFQIGWLQSIRCIVERGEELATSFGQGDDTEGMTREEMKLAEEVSCLVLGCFHTMPPIEDLLALFHTIARHVFHHMQARVVTFKENPSGVMTGSLTDAEINFDDNVDVLLRICGAQLNKMIVLRKDMLKCKHETTCKTPDNIKKELNFLQSLTMSAQDKEESLSSALTSTERGGRTFPVVNMLPFIREVVRRVKGDINDATFQQYGEKLFQVG